VTVLDLRSQRPLEAPAEEQFDRSRARQRFTSLVAIVALVLSVVSVGRSTETSVGAEELPTGDPAVPTEIELTKRPTPPLGMYGRAEYRGGGGLTGVFESDGVDQATGVFWVREPGGFLRGDPIADGRQLYISSPTYDAVYRIDLTTGGVIDPLPADGRVVVSAAVGRLAPARGNALISTILYVDEDGTAYGRAEEGTASWTVPLSEPVSAAPVIADGVGVIVTEAGRVYGFNADGRSWVFPESGTVGPITVSPAYFDGVWYVVDDRGVVYLLDAQGRQICERPIGLPPIGNLVAEDGTVYLQSVGYLATFPTDGCKGELRFTQSATDTSQAIAVNGGVAFTTDGHLLFPFRPAVSSAETEANFEVWDAPFVVGSDITTSPVLAAGLIYVGTRDGLVFAIDQSSGDLRWSFDTNLATASDVAVQGSIVVLDGAVIVMTSGGHVIAIAGEPQASAPEGEGTPSSLN
jgi:outer membrane protein assembly factor BamB